MKVALIMPTHFDPESVMAGGERYAYALSKALSRQTETTLFTFGKHQKIHRDESLTIHCERALFFAGGVVNPVAFSYLSELNKFDVIHCLQMKTFVTDLAMIYGKCNQIKTFLTDLGGGTLYSPSRVFPVRNWITGFLPISNFNLSCNPANKRPVKIIYGGVDANRFTPDPAEKKAPRLLLYVGRIFPLKGLHLLIEALPANCRLEVIGQCHDEEYLTKIKTLAQGKNIIFHGALSDEAVIQKYREALISVLPSLVDSGFTSSMESMACGTPTLGTRLGSLPEVIEDGVDGFLVPPNDAGSLRKKIEEILASPEKVIAMGPKCREKVLKQFTWDKVADRCVEAYKTLC